MYTVDLPKPRTTTVATYGDDKTERADSLFHVCTSLVNDVTTSSYTRAPYRDRLIEIIAGCYVLAPEGYAIPISIEFIVKIDENNINSNWRVKVKVARASVKSVGFRVRSVRTFDNCDMNAIWRRHQWSYQMCQNFSRITRKRFAPSIDSFDTDG